MSVEWHDERCPCLYCEKARKEQDSQHGTLVPAQTTRGAKPGILEAVESFLWGPAVWFALGAVCLWCVLLLFREGNTIQQAGGFFAQERREAPRTEMARAGR